MLVLPVDVSDGRYFEVGQVYEGIFEENNQTRIPLTLERVVETEEDELLLVFRADRLPARFVLSRFQTVRLEVDSISGIYVPRDVVSWYEGARGVFVLRGSVVYFRYIEILYEVSDYYLVKDGMEYDGEYTYILTENCVVEAFFAPHDRACCVGYKVSCGSSSVRFRKAKTRRVPYRPLSIAPLFVLYFNPHHHSERMLLYEIQWRRKDHKGKDVRPGCCLQSGRRGFGPLLGRAGQDSLGKGSGKEHSEAR